MAEPQMQTMVGNGTMGGGALLHVYSVTLSSGSATLNTKLTTIKGVAIANETNANAVKTAVSGGTVTLTGTGSDVINVWVIGY